MKYTPTVDSATPKFSWFLQTPLLCLRWNSYKLRMLDQEYFPGFAWPERARERKALGQGHPAGQILPVCSSEKGRRKEDVVRLHGKFRPLHFLFLSLSVALIIVYSLPDPRKTRTKPTTTTTALKTNFQSRDRDLLPVFHLETTDIKSQEMRRLVWLFVVPGPLESAGSYKMGYNLIWNRKYKEIIRDRLWGSLGKPRSVGTGEHGIVA